MVDENVREGSSDSRAAQPPVSGPGRGERVAEVLQRAGEFGQAFGRRLAAGPHGSLGVLRWAAGWVAWGLTGAMVVVALLHGRPQSATLWWLLVLTAELAVLPQAETQREALRHWVFVIIVVFALLAALVLNAAPGDGWWGNAGAWMMVAAALVPAPALWAARAVMLAAGWVTAALIVVFAWALLTAAGLELSDPVVRAIDPPALPLWDMLVQAVAAPLSAAAASGALVWIVRRYHRRAAEVIR